MGQINKIPLGYLNMLGSQTGGKNPFDASEIVNPTVDMVPFYHAQGMAIVSGSVNYTLITEFVEHEVPQNQTWFLYGLSTQVSFTAGTDVLQPVYTIFSMPEGAPNNSMIIRAGIRIDGVTGVAIAGDAEMFPVPIPMVAGSKVRMTIGGFTGSPRVAVFSVLVAQFSA